MSKTGTAPAPIWIICATWWPSLSSGCRPAAAESRGSATWTSNVPFCRPGAEIPGHIHAVQARSRAPGPAPHFRPEVLDPLRRRCGRRDQLRPDAARPPDRRHRYFREISAKHRHRPALVFNGREEDTFEIKLAQLSERTAGRAHPGDRRPLVLRLAKGGSPVRLWQPQGRSGTMNILADCAIARHGDEVSSASITLQPALTAPGQVRTFTRQSAYQWGGKWVRARMSGGNGLFDGGR
jgi:hypothetical protein